jgi:hypothetical protein
VSEAIAMTASQASKTGLMPLLDWIASAMSCSQFFNIASLAAASDA